MLNSIGHSDLMLQFIEGVKGQVIDNMKAQDAYATGGTASKLKTKVIIDENKMQLLGPNYFQTLITGRRPTGSGGGNSGGSFLDNIRQWVIAKGITPKPKAARTRGKKKGQAYTNDELMNGLVYAIYVNINRKGTWLYKGNKGHTFLGASNPTELLTHGIDERAKIFKTVLKTAVSDDLKRMINEILKAA